MKKIVATKDHTQRFVILSGTEAVNRDGVSIMITREDDIHQKKVICHVMLTKEEAKRLAKAIIDSV